MDRIDGGRGIVNAKARGFFAPMGLCAAKLGETTMKRNGATRVLISVEVTCFTPEGRKTHVVRNVEITKLSSRQLVIKVAFLQRRQEQGA